jgi:hypothetical protein
MSDPNSKSLAILSDGPVKDILRSARQLLVNERLKIKEQLYIKTH